MQTNIEDNRELSVKIVSDLGCTLLPNGKSLREHLTIEGISLWDVMTPSMALYYVPQSISSAQNKFTFFRRIRPYITYTKHKFLNAITRVRTGTFRSDDFIQSCSFLFMGFNAYMYSDILAPLAKQLSSTDGKKNIVLNDALYSEIGNLDSYNIQFQSLWQYWGKDAAKDARIFRHKTNKKISELTKILRAKEFNFNNSYSQGIINHAFHWLLRFDLPLLVNQVVLARIILKRCKPSLLLSPDVADIRSRVFTLVAKQVNILTLELQYGSCEENSYEWQFLLADHIAVWGNNSCENLLKQGVLEHQMTVTGSSRYDTLINVNQMDVLNTKAHLGLNNDNIIVLFASTYQQKEYNSFSLPELNDSMKKAIFNAASKVQGLTLLVKPHPLEDVDKTRSFLPSAENILFTPVSENISDLINVCDVFIGLGTTATIEAMIAKKLIICPVFEDWIWSEWLVKSDATLVPKSENEIEKIFIDLVEGSVEKIKAKLSFNQKKYINNSIYEPDGFSSKRISQLAMSLADKHY